MSWFKLNTPGDSQYKQYYDTDEDRVSVLQPILAKWQSYIENGWISENHINPYCTENKIKRFQDDCGSFILYCNSPDTLSAYKEKRNAEREVSFEYLLKEDKRLEESQSQK